MSAELNQASVKAVLSVGGLVLNDYLLSIDPIECGYRLTITRGSEVQTMDVKDGVNIENVEMVGRTGNVDTYRITFTDGSTFDYTVVTNAETYAAAEAARVDAEKGRASAERERVAAESKRVSTEEERAQIFAAYQGEINGLKDDLDNYNSSSFNSWTKQNSNLRGVSFSWSDNVCSVSGTATGESYINIYANSSGFPEGLEPNKEYDFLIDSTDEHIMIRIYFMGMDSEKYITFYKSSTFHIPSGCTGLVIRILVLNGNTVNGTISSNIAVTKSNTELNNSCPSVIPNSNRNVTELIEYMLSEYGYIHLQKGEYIIGDLQMPDNTIIQGAGEATIIKSISGKNGIIVGANCTIENVKITSDEGHTQSRGTTAGILVQGNYDDSPLKFNTKINNVTISGFSLAGIYGKSTGHWVANSISATNCRIYNCYAGIALEDFCEFNRFTNMLCYDNYTGLLNNSGNNVFTNCSFSNNTVGIYFDCIDNDRAGNNGHGAVIGCTINHSNNNNGYAMIIKGVSTNGYIFSECNIWYGKILIEENCNGILITNSLFGGGTPTITSWTSSVFLTNCLFKEQPTFTGNTNKIIKNNCYLFDGTAIN